MCNHYYNILQYTIFLFILYYSKHIYVVYKVYYISFQVGILQKTHSRCIFITV